jgi:beta-galactosidase
MIIIFKKSLPFNSNQEGDHIFLSDHAGKIKVSKHPNFRWILVLLLFVNLSLSAQIRQTRSLDFNWQFMIGDYPGAENPAFDDSKWRTLNVPHDWSIEHDFKEDTPFGSSICYLPTGIGWYRKTIDLTKEDLRRNLRIAFDGVYMNSDVWINGHHMGHYPFGYNSFYYTLNQHAKAGKNTLAVRVDNSIQPSSRWYSGSGIYRHVWLVSTNLLQIEPYGIYLTTPEIKKESALIEIQSKIENNSAWKREALVLSIVTDKSGIEKARTETPFVIESGGHLVLKQNLQVANPKLWSPDAPVLYKLKSCIVEKGKITDDLTTNFGIRHIEYQSEKGFLLNGIQTKMKGVNLHHDGGAVGAAVPEAVWIRRLNIMKEMGCNAIRTAHNPVAPEFLDLCDSLGFLVMDEAFDEWKMGKREFAYNKYFDQWHEFDLTRMIQRDRNHPSVVLWSVGNEVLEQSDPKGHLVLKKLMDICHREDPTRPVTVGCDRMDLPNSPTTAEFLEALDVVGYNYVDRYLHRRELSFLYDRAKHPYWKVIGTENSAVYSVRGDYSMGSNPDKVSVNYNTTMIDPELLQKNVITNDFVAGDFMWSGIDYLGESKWPNISPPTGTTDRCGFPKDSYYFYKSMWTDQPVVHLFPHWNWTGREGQIIPVLCYTNCESVELFVNGKSYGEKRKKYPRTGKTICGNWSTYSPLEHITTTDLHLTWDVEYQPGIIQAVGKTGGKVVYTHEIKTAGQAVAIRLSADKQIVNANKRDVAHVKVEIVGKDGNVVPTADHLVDFTIEGEGKLIGVDNGNPQDHNSFKLNQRNAFNGLCLALVQTNGKPGNIRVTAKSKGLKESSIEIQANIYIKK